LQLETRNSKLETLIFGGGVAGLWLLDELHRTGYAALLLERFALGQGQTVASQGIIHGGLKYTLKGRLTGSAQAIADAPGVWRDCLEGRRTPDLTHTAVRAEYCHLWRTGSLRSIAGAIGAKKGLRIAPRKIGRDERPPVLRDCPGDVLRLDEQVIDPVSMLRDLAGRHQPRLARYETVAFDGLRVIVDGLTLEPRTIILTAGEGNALLREQLGLDPHAMQRRPLHMAMVRGENLPILHGHCADGMATRVTITTAGTPGGFVWQLGGQLAERGVAMPPEELIRFAKHELEAVLPGFDASGGGVQWATYRVDRAEAKTPGLLRPEEVTALKEGHVVTAWPTKLAMAPHLARKIMAMLPPPSGQNALAWPDAMPRPNVAPPPWETCTWTDAP